MQYNDKFTVTEGSAKTLTQDLGSTSNSALLKKRSSRLCKKMGGGSPTETKEPNALDLDFPALPKISCVLSKTEALEKNLV